MSTQNEANVLAVAVQLGLVPDYCGTPGVGKSRIWEQIVESLSKQMNKSIPFHVKYGSRIVDATDLCGLYDLSGDYVKFKPWAWAWELKQAEHGMLVIDEWNQCEFQGVLLSVMLDKVLGDLDLKHVWMGLASNPANCGVNVIATQPPTSNRQMHIDRDFDEEAKQEWLKVVKTPGRKMKFTVHVPVLPDNWEVNLDKWCAIVGNFYENRPSLINNLPKTEKDRSKGWPSPRSNDSVMKWLAGAEACNLTKEEMYMGTAGLIGHENSKSMFTYIQELDLVPPEVVFSNVDKWQVPKKSDTAYVMMAECMAYFNTHNTKANWEKVWDIVHKYTEAGRKDLSSPFVKELCDLIDNKTNYPLPADHIIDPYKKLNADILAAKAKIADSSQS